MNDLLTEMFTDFEKIINDFTATLEGHGVKVQSKRLSQLVERVKDLKTMRKGIDYAGLALDDNGYVVKAFKLGDFVPVEVLPADATKGYYKLVDGNFVLDEERQRLLNEV